MNVMSIKVKGYDWLLSRMVKLYGLDTLLCFKTLNNMSQRQKKGLCYRYGGLERISITLVR